MFVYIQSIEKLFLEIIWYVQNFKQGSGVLLQIRWATKLGPQNPSTLNAWNKDGAGFVHLPPG